MMPVIGMYVLMSISVNANLPLFIFIGLLREIIIHSGMLIWAAEQSDEHIGKSQVSHQTLFTSFKVFGPIYKFM